MHDTGLRLDILTRVSRTMGREGDSYGSPDIQLRDCRSWIALNGHVEGVHFHEENVSGGALLANRPGLQAVIARMRSGDSDGVVVRAYDRFMRSVQLSWEVIELVEGKDGRRGIGRLFAAQGNVDFQSPTGRLLFTQLQSLAQYQREHARHEWAVARTRAWERGVWLARPPFGYVKLTAAMKQTRPRGGRVVLDDGRWLAADEVAEVVVGGLVVDQQRAPFVRELFARRAADEPLSELARWLGDADGRAWSPNVISKLLGNVAYLGRSELHRCDRDDDGRIVAREVMLSRPDDHEPLVDDATFRLVQHARGLSRTTRTVAGEPYLLTGFVRCAGCRYLLRPDCNARGFRTYTCRGQHGMGQCPAPAYAGARQLETFIRRAILALDDVEIAAAPAVDLGDRRAEVAEISEEVRRLVGQLRRSRFPRLVEDELGSAETQLAEAEHRLAVAERQARTTEQATRTLADVVENGSIDEQRAVLSAYVDRIVLRRGTEALDQRVLLLLRGEEAAFEPLPGRGRRVALCPWPAWDHNHLAGAGAAE